MADLAGHNTMNIRNWLFGRIIPVRLLKTVTCRHLCEKGVALMYHEVLSDNKGPAAWTVVKASAFKEQMVFLKDHFDVITIDAALERTKSSEKFTKPYAVVTFDDGYLGNLTCMLPIVEELKIPVTVFIATRSIEAGILYWYDRIIALLDYDKELIVDLVQYGLGQYKLNASKKEKVNWNEMQQLLTALKTLLPQVREQAVNDILGNVDNIPVRLRMLSKEDVVALASSSFVTVGGHSHCHNILPQLPDRELNESIVTNRHKLKKWTSQEVSHFSYPNGNFDVRVISAVKSAGYISGVTTHGGVWAKNVNAFRLPRYGIGRFDSLGLLIARVGQLA